MTELAKFKHASLRLDRQKKLVLMGEPKCQGEATQELKSFTFDQTPKGIVPNILEELTSWVSMTGHCSYVLAGYKGVLHCQSHIRTARHCGYRSLPCRVRREGKPTYTLRYC